MNLGLELKLEQLAVAATKLLEAITAEIKKPSASNETVPVDSEANRRYTTWNTGRG